MERAISTDARLFTWNEIVPDEPIALLRRRKVEGENSLVAQVHLETGCHVARHRHPSEQIAIHVSGRALWKLGETAREQVVEAGQVLVLPSDSWHEVIALEDTVIIDILSPPGAMGVDSQSA
jgi:quercetin dioxygenase-like cupin family protein